MLYVSSIVTVVGKKGKGIFSPQRVTFWDTNEDAVGAELSFMNPVISLRMNQDRMLVGLEGLIYIYDYELNEIAQIKVNDLILKYAMSPTAENPYLAITVGETGEDLAIYDISTGKLWTKFKAHDSPVYLIIFNERGTLLASASDKVLFFKKN